MTCRPLATMALVDSASGPTCESTPRPELIVDRLRDPIAFDMAYAISLVACLVISLLLMLRSWQIMLNEFQEAGHDFKMAPDSIGATAAYHNGDRANDRPDRPIRPLPKRRLRERLSPEVADSIKYPPAPQTTPALFSYLCNLKGSILEDEPSATSRNLPSDTANRQALRKNGVAAEALADEVAPRRTVVPRPPTESIGRPARLQPRPDASRQGNALQAVPSAASSADGYDSFENTNNKKKRKIPTAGEMNGAHGLGDHGLNDAHSHPGGLAVTSDPSGENGGSTSVPYYGSGSFVPSGQNVSGPGRGRFGRARNARCPLQSLSDASGNWLGRGSKTRSSAWSPQPEKFATSSREGQENTSLLDQPHSVEDSPTATQFTFTCDSQVPGSLAWPGSGPKTPGNARAGFDAPHAVRSYPHSRVAQTQHQAMPDDSPQQAAPSDSSLQAEASESVNSERKNRRRLARELNSQARRRRDETARQNQTHAPKPEDQWICEFCEYERIFGYPPVALIRQYEIKDRKLRQQEEERRRVWEKAKARSRKGKKSRMPSKNQANNHVQAHDSHQASPMGNTHSQDTQSEVFDDEEEDEDEDYEGEGHYQLDSEPIEQHYEGEPEGDPDGGTRGGGGGANRDRTRVNDLEPISDVA
ncbi:hypothetical protein BD289DRAFT_456086 [Coniella lustricola]|uniref:Uncharacterized protein n=1 Tax=Coniella lustricola TaxID=2025994 RepID=A0A2T2ZX79_9PEZI|nr:hypothetical protein BD289DRAFT_456086 [Coniella lustricola]